MPSPFWKTNSSSRFIPNADVHTNKLSVGAKSEGVRDHDQDSRILVVSLYMVTFFLYVAAYKYYLTPYWGYMGFIDYFNPLKMMIACATAFAFSLFSPVKFGTRSFFINFCYTFYLLPSLVIFAYTDMPFYSAGVVVVSMVIVTLTSSINIERISVSALPAKYLIWIFSALTAGLLVSTYFIGGVRYFNLDISRVYEFREGAAEDLPDIFAYLISIFANVFIPFGVIISLKYRMYIFTALLFLMSVILFGFTSHKSILFAPIVILILYYFLLIFRSYSVILIALAIMLACGVASELYAQAYGGASVLDWFNTLLIRRTIMVPPLLDYLYIDYFGYSEKYYWSNSFITFGMIPEYYGIPAPKIIGEIFFSNADMSANTGFIGSGFAQAGLAGTIFYAIGVGAMFALFDAYGRYLGQPFVAAALFAQVVTMVRASDFLTMFLTHGILMSFIVLVFVRTPESEQIEKAMRLSSSRTSDGG